MKKNYIIQVAPLIRLPILRTQVFSYLHDRPLPAGTLVSVPFYRKILRGIVISSKKDFPRRGGFELKYIYSADEELYLAPWQIELAKKLSKYYMAPLGLFLKPMVPEKIKNRKKKIEKIRKIKNKRKLTNSLEVKTLFDSKRKKILVVGSARARLVLNISLIAEIIKLKKQCLILIPEVYLAFEMQKRLEEEFPGEEIAIFHGKIPKGQFFDQWEKIRKGEAKIAVATKMGVFLPFSGLGLVIVEEEQDISHKQWNMSPRYNAVRAAEILAEAQGAKLILGSASTSIETLWYAKKEKWPIFDLGKNEKKSINTSMADLFKERKGLDFPISKTLSENISRALDKKQKILLLAKRRGYSTFSVCQSCKSIFKCSHCDRALVYFDETGDYRCLHCSFRAELLGFCPACGGFQFSHFGIGTQLVEKKIRKLFPSANIARLDVDKMKRIRDWQKISERLKKNDIDIVIGTQMALKLGGFFGFDLVGIVSGHDFLSIPDFNSDEQALANFSLAGNLIRENGQFIIQTFSPRQEIFKYLGSGSRGEFFEKEISLRKKFSYPPFSRLVKLVFRDKSKKRAEKETQKIFDLLWATGNNETEISEPYEPLAAKKRGYFYRNILIKAKPGKDFAKLSLYPIIGGLKKGWTVDVDPIGAV